MALSETQKATVRLYCGWQARFLDIESRLEEAMRSLATQPESEALITNALNVSPPGILAILADLDTKIRAAYARLQASAVGSITLNPAEVAVLRMEGRRYVGRLCSILGIPRGEDVFSPGSGSRNGNYIGI